MDALFEAKKEKGLSFADLAKSVGKDEVFAASLFYAQNRAESGDVAALSDALGVPKETLSIVLVYGTTLKAVVHEKFGDGIMSAVMEFKMTVDKEKWNGSDYVKVTLLGKFLPYRKW
ncbi:Cyanase [Gonapodya prolifera JEL478]|uniref:Cyanase n=1 Tax=Gonapodya prolifera (strain JEL478) TaxID=1344416 RepID=A0A139AB45_GONPJ|nr:Cyanase [Gonapodya prolifera JEL478]|eukprot:KXS14026.1 Cyanase [Gonapodya prolifera JEL478]